MNIVITGCSQGIGAELVKIWSKDHFIYGISRNEKKLNELKNTLDKKENFKFLAESITQLNSSSIDSFIDSDKIDLLVNNAGFLVNKPFEEINYEDYKQVMDTNFWGIFNLSQLLLSRLSNARGHILNISSMGGVMNSSKFPGLSLYSSSKGAVSILSECLYEELKPHNIRVNALALGAVQTEMLSKAFPNYKAETSPNQMARFIDSIIINGDKLLNGQIIKVSSSNP